MKLFNPNLRSGRKLETYIRSDGKCAWRVRGTNGQVVATDGGQGYDKMDDCIDMAQSVTGLKAEYVV